MRVILKKVLLSIGFLVLFAGCGKKVAEDTADTLLDVLAMAVDVTPVAAADVDTPTDATPSLPQDVTK